MQRIYRLTNNSSFSYIFKNGVKYRNPLITLYCLKAGSVKVGISVSKKVGNSVVRSKVKRRIKEAFRLLIPDLSGKYNFVAVAADACAEASYAEIDSALKLLLNRAGVLKRGEIEVHL